MDIIKQSGYEWIQEYIKRSSSCNNVKLRKAVRAVWLKSDRRIASALLTVSDHAASVIRTLAEDCYEFAPVAIIRIRAAVYKLQAVAAHSCTLTVSLRDLISTHHIRAIAAGVIATLILVIAPTGAASMRVIHASDDYVLAAESGSGTQEAAMIFLEQYVEEYGYTRITDEPLPMAAGVVFAGQRELYIYDSGVDSANNEYARAPDIDTGSAANDAASITRAWNIVSDLDYTEAIEPIQPAQLPGISEGQYPGRISADQDYPEDSGLLLPVTEPFLDDIDAIGRIHDIEVSEVLSSTIYSEGNIASSTYGDGENGDAVDSITGVLPETDSLTASTGEYIWPTTGHLTSFFGRRSTSVGSTVHKGIDICGSYGQSIYAADGGEVIVSAWSNSYGYVIQIEHDNGEVTLYCHCRSLLVSVGERVRQGQEIARMGNTGLATGTHLHFEVIVDGVNVDPLPHLPQDMEDWGVWI